jgi:Alpha-kinase family
MVNRLLQLSSAGKYSQIDTFVDKLSQTTKKFKGQMTSE